jgi:hypothetical protein
MFIAFPSGTPFFTEVILEFSRIPEYAGPCVHARNPC